MTREQIEKKAKAFADSLSDGLYYDGKYHQCRKHGFIQGAEWTLSNLWTSVEDDLPPFEEDVIVYSKGGFDEGFRFGHRSDDDIVMTDNNKFAISFKDEVVTYWMRIPELPK